jgi:hypothetical protein
MKRNGKGGEPSLRDKLNAAYLEAFQADFAEHGIEAIREMRKSKPEKYCEIGQRLGTAAQEISNPNELHSNDSTREIAQKVLQSIGFAAPDEDSITAAVEANETYVATLEGIRDKAIADE